MASRVSYAIQEITQLSQSQRKTSRQVKQTQENMTMISDEVVRTKEIVQQISVTDEETVKQGVLLEKQVNTLQTQLQETRSKLILWLVNTNSSTYTV